MLGAIWALGLFQGAMVVLADSATIGADASSSLVQGSIPAPERLLTALSDDDGDKNITLRGGVLIAPPFAIYNEEESVYTGFQGDLLRRLQLFAAADGYDLRFDLELSPQKYGAALDWIANDCNTSANPNLLEDCQRFDLIIGDYYCNGDRSIRVEFSPSWLRTTMSTIKTVKDPEDKAAQQTDYTTLSQLQSAGGTACVPEDTYLSTVVMGKFPRVNYNLCPSPDECIRRLKDGECSLYADDELALRYRALDDTTLEVTGEQFNSQYIVWPISYSLEKRKTLLLKKWMFDSVSNATLDTLSYTYFTLKLCPLGLSGKNCDENCDPKHGTSDRSGKCICKSTKWTGEDCSIEVKENLNIYPTWEVALCYTLFAINVMACVICAVWIFWKRTDQKVKVSQPFFLYLVLLGSVISSASIVPLVQQSNGDGPVPACYVFPWLFCVGFSVMYGTLFAKIQRVYKLFKASAMASGIVVTKTETILVICAITSVDIVVCAVWTAIDRLHWTRVVSSADQFGEPLESAGYCTSAHWQVFVSVLAIWHLILLLGGVQLCYVSRHISQKFVESKYLLVAMMSHLQIYVVSIPVLFLVGADPTASLFIRTGVIWINDFAIIFIIFGGLMYTVHFGKDDEADVAEAMTAFARRTSHPGSTAEARELGSSMMRSAPPSVSQIRRRVSLNTINESGPDYSGTTRSGERSYSGTTTRSIARSHSGTTTRSTERSCSDVTTKSKEKSYSGATAKSKEKSLDNVQRLEEKPPGTHSVDI